MTMTLKTPTMMSMITRMSDLHLRVIWTTIEKRKMKRRQPCDITTSMVVKSPYRIRYLISYVVIRKAKKLMNLISGCLRDLKVTLTMMVTMKCIDINFN